MDVGVYKKLNDMSGIVNSNRMAYAITEPKELIIPTYDGSGEGVHPSVVYVPAKIGGHRWWMGFTPYPNGVDDYENPSILCSDDGINWVVPDGVTNPIVPPPADTVNWWNADVELIYNTTTKKLMMYYCLFSKTGVAEQYLIESSNGVNWTEPIKLNQVLGATGIVQIKEDSFIAYTGQYTEGEKGITAKTSTDGKVWTTNITGIVNIAPCIHFHISTYLDSSGYHFLSAGMGTRSKTAPREIELFYGYSRDGKTIVFDSTPLLQRNSADWIGRRLYRSSMINVGNGKYRVYISGEALDKSWHMGYIDIVINNPQIGLSIMEMARFIKIQNEPVVIDLCKDLEIRDAAPIVLRQSAEEFQIYKHKALTVVSSLNQSLEFSLSANWRNNGDIYYGGTSKTIEKFVIPISNGWEDYVITQENLTGLGLILPPVVNIKVKATAIPTTGSLSVKLICWN